MKSSRWINAALVAVVLLMAIMIFGRFGPKPDETALPGTSGAQTRSPREQAAGEPDPNLARAGPLARQMGTNAPVNDRPATTPSSSPDRSDASKTSLAGREPSGFPTYTLDPAGFESDEEILLQAYPILETPESGSSRLRS